MAHSIDAATANSADIIGMAVAASCSFVLLLVIITTAVIFFCWTNWFRKMMYQKGKIKMPRSYFQKKEDAKKKLISVSQNSIAQGANGSVASQVVDRASLVNGGHARYPSQANREYETKTASVDLGDEGEEIFTIEAEIVDNEVLDVGPFKHDHSKMVPVKGDVYPDPYIYSSVDRSVRSSEKSKSYPFKQPEADYPSTRTTEKGTSHLDPEYSTGGEESNTPRFDPSLLYL